MAYTPTNWNIGDLITEEKLDKLEQGLAEVSNEVPTGSPAFLAKIATPDSAQTAEIANKVNEIIDQLIARGICNA